MQSLKHSPSNLFANSLFSRLKGFFLRQLHYICSLIFYGFMVVGSLGSTLGIILSSLFFIALCLAYFFRKHKPVKYILAAVSVCALFTALLLVHMDFDYVTQFIYCIPLLYAFLLADFFSPSIIGLCIIFLFSTYGSQYSSAGVTSSILGIAGICILYTMLAYSIRRLTEERDRFYKVSITDSLTGLATLDHTLKSGQQMLDSGSIVTALVIDLDHLKQVNDTYGHLVGNKVLIQIAKLLKNEMSEFKSIVGRLGGDEFVILVENYSRLLPEKLSERLYRRLKDELFQADPELDSIRISFAIGEAQSHGRASTNIQDLLHTADMNMYYNKHQTVRAIPADNSLNRTLLPQSGRHLLQVLSEKDMYTYVHSQYTAEYASALGKALNMPRETVEQLYIAGWLHDVGKLFISNEILRKPSRLTDEEYNIVREHVLGGLRLLASLEDFSFSEEVKNGILFHHERWDGMGYPQKAIGDETPLEGKILQIADAFSAMTIKRVYRKNLSLEEAAKEIRKNAGSQFDPELVELFIGLLEKRKFSLK